jgi:hypothetical protein
VAKNTHSVQLGQVQAVNDDIVVDFRRRNSSWFGKTSTE